MVNDMIEFKSNTHYFDDEKSGLKNNTIRKIDMRDFRFLRLMDMMKFKDWDREIIKITRKELPNDSFQRQIKHITQWNNYLVITWRD